MESHAGMMVIALEPLQHLVLTSFSPRAPADTPPSCKHIVKLDCRERRHAGVDQMLLFSNCPSNSRKKCFANSVEFFLYIYFYFVSSASFQTSFFSESLFGIFSTYE